MSDSSEDEDLSRFREAVDSSFTKIINASRGIRTPQDKVIDKPKSERYLEEASHYNDVKVPEELQKQIAAKVSAVINKNIKFVDVEQTDVKYNLYINPAMFIRKRKIKGGVKLFKHSESFLSCEDPEDTYTEKHNAESKKLKRNKRQIDAETKIDEDEKVKAVAVTGDYILSKQETKCWKSRRKEKLFKYKKHGHILKAVE